VPGEALIVRGPYRYVRHPNYLAVAIELATLPLIHGAYLTAIAFSAMNAALLRVRIRTEQAALGRLAGSGRA
jgi:methyltransferase